MDAFFAEPNYPHFGVTIEKVIQRVGLAATDYSKRFHKHWAKAGGVPHWFQRPQLYTRNLATMPFHDPKQHYPHIYKALKKNWTVIRGEAMAVLGDAYYEPQKWIREGSMSQFVLWSNGTPGKPLLQAIFFFFFFFFFFFKKHTLTD